MFTEPHTTSAAWKINSLDQVNDCHEPYDGVTKLIHVALGEATDTDPEWSVLARVGIKIVQPKVYAGGSDHEKLGVRSL